VLVRKHPPTKGKDGRDLFGQRIIARHGEDASLACGENVAFGPDGRSLVARKSGVAKLNENGSVSVEDVITVNDVDLASGSLCTLGAVVVDGNVTEGFSIEAIGDVYIRGNVEGGTVVSGGRVVVGGGVRLHGKVDAVGPVAVRFVDPDCSIHTLSDLDVIGSAIGAQLSALGPVVVGGEIAGGRSESATHIHCQRAGSEGDVRTLFVVRTGPTEEALAMTRNELAALERRLVRGSSPTADADDEPVPSLRAPLVPQGVGHAPSLPSVPSERPSVHRPLDARSDTPARPSGALPVRPLPSPSARPASSLAPRPSTPGITARPSLPQRPASLAIPSAPRISGAPQRPSVSLPARPLGSVPSMRVAAVSARPSQQLLARPSTASMRAAPPVRATDSPIASAKKAFQADHQLLATRRQVAFHREQGAAGTAATPFVLVDEAIHAGVVVRIDREERRIDGSLFAQRFVVIDGALHALAIDAPYLPEPMDATPEA
jgi:hypothetical protein